MPNRSTTHGRGDDQIERVANDVRHAVENVGAQAQERIAELGDAAREQVRALETGLEARIREKPLKAVLIAAGVGVLFGVLWRR